MFFLQCCIDIRNSSNKVQFVLYCIMKYIERKPLVSFYISKEYSTPVFSDRIVLGSTISLACIQVQRQVILCPWTTKPRSNCPSARWHHHHVCMVDVRKKCTKKKVCMLKCILYTTSYQTMKHQLSTVHVSINHSKKSQYFLLFALVLLFYFWKFHSIKVY